MFDYAGNQRSRSVLIDFGSTGKGKPEEGQPQNAEDPTAKRMWQLQNIFKQTCGGKLDVVVATHRHKDHIYGFGLKDAGELIVDCKPDVVIQPWTEDPEDLRDLSRKNSPGPKEFKDGSRQHFVGMLEDMHDVAASIETEALQLAKGIEGAKVSAALRDNILFAADDNKVKNAKAVENLQKMGKNHYVSFGYDKIPWNEILPGVKVHILGPPTIEDSSKVTSATSKSDEFWSLQAMNKYFWGVQSATGRSEVGGVAGTPLFGRGKVMRSHPANVRWAIRQLRSIRANQLLEIVRFVDSALNNTSVIMLFEVGDQKLLFPGDAQIENWQYLLDRAGKDSAVKKY